MSCPWFAVPPLLQEKLLQAAGHSSSSSSTSAAAAATANNGQLQLAIAAALQGVRLTGGASFDQASGTKTTALLLKGLDAQGVEQYTLQLMQKFASAAAAVAAEGGGEGKEQREVEGTRAQLLEQLAAAAKFPAATAATAAACCKFFGAVAFLEVEGGGVQKLVKKLQSPELQLLVTLGDVLVTPGGVSASLRRLAGARLVGLLQHMYGKATTAVAAAASGGAVAGGGGKGGEKKKRKVEEGGVKEMGQGEEQSREAAVAAARQQQEAVLGDLLQFVTKATANAGVSLATTSEEALEALEQYRGLATAIQSSSSVAAVAGRRRALLHLVQVLQLQLLLGGVALEEAVGAVEDLQTVVAKGLGIPGVLEGSDSEEDEESEGSKKPQWMDLMVDLILALLSVTGEGGGGEGGEVVGAGGVVQVPTGLLREACEGTFRVHAELLTSTGASA